MKKGFTLAEVLITLGIIGVVAAMTLPVLTAKYKLKVFETAFKKQYSIIQNAINYLTIENNYYACYNVFEGDDYISTTDDCENLTNDLVDKLEVRAVNSNVKAQYITSTKLKAEGGIMVNEHCQVDTGRYQTYVTKDGAFIMIRNTGMLPGIILDTNGEKKPNKWGYDVFWLNFTNKNKKTRNILLTDEYCSQAEKGGVLPRTILRNEKTNSSTSWTW